MSFQILNCQDMASLNTILQDSWELLLECGVDNPYAIGIEEKEKAVKEIILNEVYYK